MKRTSDFIRIVAAVVALFALVLLGSETGGALAGAPTMQEQNRGPLQTSGPAGSSSPAAPRNPYVVLYDQYNNPGANGISSQNFETANNAYDDQAADDFVVPAGQTWNVNLVEVDGVYFNGPGPAASVNVFIYTGGSLPASPVVTRTNLLYSGSAGDFSITLSPAVTLSPGTYWVSVQANQDAATAGQWGWIARTVTSNSASAWRNPGGGFGICPSWGTRPTTCAIQPTQPDHVFRLSGVLVTATPTLAPTSTPIPGCLFQTTGSITAEDAVQLGRLNRTSPTGCAPDTCPGLMDTMGRHYDSYSFLNSSNSSQCVDVLVDSTGCAPGGSPSGAAFLDSSGHGSFLDFGDGLLNPADLCTDYIGDNGTSGTGIITYSFTVGPGQAFTILINEVTPGEGCDSYFLRIDGCELTQCTVEFSDVAPGSTFYPFVRCLACRNVLGGYADGTFRPGNNITRGQLSKIVSNSAGFEDPPGEQIFEDVPPGSTFYDWVQRLANRGIIGGYACGGPGEPCVPPGNRHYFRPNNNATRGQISKIVSNAAGFIDPPGEQIFEDVPPGSTFYDWVQRLSNRGIMGGYPCGGPGEPCGPGNLPYFRPNNNATRGQTAKIVSSTFFPGCSQ